MGQNVREISFAPEYVKGNELCIKLKRYEAGTKKDMKCYKELKKRYS